MKDDASAKRKSGLRLRNKEKVSGGNDSKMTDLPGTIGNILMKHGARQTHSFPYLEHLPAPRRTPETERATVNFRTDASGSTHACFFVSAP